MYNRTLGYENVNSNNGMLGKYNNTYASHTNHVC